tara:strand:- start:1260 stop:1394 length:135 start_codon:yes stop_codon:yes gene_type:complete
LNWKKKIEKKFVPYIQKRPNPENEKKKFSLPSVFNGPGGGPREL